MEIEIESKRLEAISKMLWHSPSPKGMALPDAPDFVGIAQGEQIPCSS
jgi:hypothetical protein